MTSPGGFVAGITPENIITHPSKSRNGALTKLLAAVGVAEQQGIGVDRMVGEMLRLGLPAPDIREHSGPEVVTTLVGQAVPDSWMRWLRRFDDSAVQRDLRVLMIVNALVERGWIDTPRAARLLQVSEAEARDSLNRMADIRFEEGPALRSVDGTPADSDNVYVLRHRPLARLLEFDRKAGWHHDRPSRKALALDYAKARGRISTTELGSLVNAAPTNVGGILRSLEDEGLLEPSRAVRRGAGFYYRYVDFERGS